MKMRPMGGSTLHATMQRLSQCVAPSVLAETVVKMSAVMMAFAVTLFYATIVSGENPAPTPHGKIQLVSNYL